MSIYSSIQVEDKKSSDAEKTGDGNDKSTSAAK